MMNGDQATTKKKRIAVFGGGAHTIPNYRAMLNLLARDFDLILFSEFYLGNEWKVKDYPIYSVPNVKLSSKLRELLFFLIALRGCLTKRVDIIHSHSTYPSGLAAILIGKLLRIPVLVCLDAAEGSSVADIKFGDTLNPRRIKINKWVLNHANAVTALTNFQTDEVRVNLNFSKFIHVIPRGIELQKFQPKKEQAIKQPVRFLNVAYLHPVKDHETLLKTFQLILNETDATLTVAGEDYEQGRIQQLARQLNIHHRVRFAGFVSHESIANYYHEADILLHTSRYESQATVVMEAMATGVLVCGTHVGLMADLSERCCLTAAPKDFKGLADKVLQLLSSSSVQDSLRKEAFSWAIQHSLEWSTDQYRIIYRELLSRRKPK